MSTRQFVNDLQHDVKELQVKMAMNIASGSMSDMEMYHRNVGRIEGMNTVLSMARERLNRQETDPDGLPEMTTGRK